MKARSREARAILKLLAERAPEASICPSEVARALDPDGWRSRMDAVRDAAAALAAAGKVLVTQRGKPVTLPAHGPIRIRRADENVPTPDGRYLVIKGRLWRAANPRLAPAEKERLVAELMTARRDVAAGLRAEDEAAVRAARKRVHAAKVALGERGPVWWTDGARDENRVAVDKSTYAAWHAGLRRG